MGVPQIRTRAPFRRAVLGMVQRVSPSDSPVTANTPRPSPEHPSVPARISTLALS